jgi:hypothetical protein
LIKGVKKVSKDLEIHLLLPFGKKGEGDHIHHHADHLHQSPELMQISLGLQVVQTLHIFYASYPSMKIKSFCNVSR